MLHSLLFQRVENLGGYHEKVLKHTCTHKIDPYCIILAKTKISELFSPPLTKVTCFVSVSGHALVQYVCGWIDFENRCLKAATFGLSFQQWTIGTYLQALWISTLQFEFTITCCEEEEEVAKLTGKRKNNKQPQTNYLSSTEGILAPLVINCKTIIKPGLYKRLQHYMAMNYVKTKDCICFYKCSKWTRISLTYTGTFEQTLSQKQKDHGTTLGRTFENGTVTRFPLKSFFPLINYP